MKHTLALTLLCCVWHAVFAHAQAATNPPSKVQAQNAKVFEHASLKVDPTAVVCVKDPKTRIIVLVESDGRRLLGLSDEGRMLWSVDVISVCGLPKVGEPIVRHLSLKGDSVSVVFGKHSVANVRMSTGEITCEGSD
jgi:hypothetical protein